VLIWGEGGSPGVCHLIRWRLAQYPVLRNGTLSWRVSLPLLRHALSNFITAGSAHATYGLFVYTRFTTQSRFALARGCRLRLEGMTCRSNMNYEFYNWQSVPCLCAARLSIYQDAMASGMDSDVPQCSMSSAGAGNAPLSSRPSPSEGVLPNGTLRPECLTHVEASHAAGPPCAILPFFGGGLRGIDRHRWGEDAPETLSFEMCWMR
jgi:hypothetical protein